MLRMIRKFGQQQFSIKEFGEQKTNKETALLIKYIKIQKKKHFGFTDVMLLHSGHKHVSVNHLQDGKNKYQNIIKYN